MNKQREDFLKSETERLKTQNEELFRFAVENLALSVGLRDAYTGEHSRRVTTFALLLGRHLELSAEDLEVLRYGTRLHDLGKIGIEDGILRKPGPLTPEEFDVMKTHTTAGEKIVQMVPDLRRALPIVRSHHERWDGQGYPDGVAGEDISRLARMVAVADALDTLLFDTPYRRGQSVEAAFAEIEGQSGRQFDPAIVSVLLRIQPEIVQEVLHFEKK